MPSSFWDADLEATEAFVNQSNEASLEDELELLPPAAEQALEELLPSASVEGITAGVGGRHLQQATLGDELQLLPPTAVNPTTEAEGRSSSDACSEAGGSSSSSSSNDASFDWLCNNQQGFSSIQLCFPLPTGRRHYLLCNSTALRLDRKSVVRL